MCFHQPHKVDGCHLHDVHMVQSHKAHIPKKSYFMNYNAVFHYSPIFYCLVQHSYNQFIKHSRVCKALLLIKMLPELWNPLQIKFCSLMLTTLITIPQAILNMNVNIHIFHESNSRMNKEYLLHCWKFDANDKASNISHNI